MLYSVIAVGLFGLSLYGGHHAVASGGLKLEKVDPGEQRESIRQTTSQDPHRHLLALLKNNLTATAILLIAGAGSAGLYALFYLGWFGFNMGMLIARLTMSGIEGSLVAALLVPHGLVEVPALCVAGGVGLRSGLLFVRYLRDGSVPEDVERRQLLWTAVVSLGMIVVAGFLEAYLTPRVAIRYL